MLKILRSNPAADPRTDDELLAQYRASGEARYLGALYERYMPMVYGVCLKIYRDSGKAEDAVMGIYEELTRKVPEHQIDSFRGWLYVLARNYCLMEWRKNNRRPTDFHPPEDMVYYDAVEAPFEVELPANNSSPEKPLTKCLDELPGAQRQSVELFYFKEKSYKEIADLLSEEVGKIRSYIQNGRRNLKICLEKAGVKNSFGE
ncbi:MAG: sigma-70 family RNA polymerase sigma factor [Lewinellaceae bacterium]|nr:sigma-70 family RNA polymerase sigma factor [Saprospiraceae bacterium]MCB9329916.1 sigma-70 family RNA polymerase sigma factor [Lewinellaceae bacterium]